MLFSQADCGKLVYMSESDEDISLKRLAAMLPLHRKHCLGRELTQRKTVCPRDHVSLVIPEPLDAAVPEVRHDS